MPIFCKSFSKIYEKSFQAVRASSPKGRGIGNEPLSLLRRQLPRFLQIFRPPPAIISQKGAGLIRAVIYLDVLLLVNFLTTALFLLAAGLLCGVSTSGGRVVGGALAGAAASLILLAPALPWPVSVGYQLASGVGIVLLGYGFPGGRCFLRLLAWFAALHFALTGAVLLPGAQANNFSIYLPLSPGLLLVCAGGVYLAVQGILRFLGRNGGQTFPVTTSRLLPPCRRPNSACGSSPAPR